jgi:hypothetical protein
VALAPVAAAGGNANANPLLQLMVEHPDEYLRAGKLTVQKNGRQLTVASWNDDEMSRTRTPAGHTVIALSPPLKLVHAPFVFNIEVAATQSVGCELIVSLWQQRASRTD